MIDERRDLLDLLGYSPAWLECGLVSEAFLERQAEEFDTSEDKSTEHYRYAAFQTLLREHPALSDQQVMNYVELAARDRDVAMAGAALGDLIVWRGLTDAQLAWVAAQPAAATPFLQKAVGRRRLLAELRSGALTDDLYQRCLNSGDTVLQSVMLEICGITRPQIERLGENGTSHSIRNRAKARLRRPEYRRKEHHN